MIKTEREHGNRVRLSVRDAGMGLPPQGVDSLFDAFHTTKSGGMGLGLFVSRSILETHLGRLWAEPNDGPGATFITADGDGTVRSRLLAQGAVECLFKPFSETALLDALNVALRMR